jgi:hypothetical protein
MAAINSNPAPMLGTILNQGKKWQNWMSHYKNLGVTKVDLRRIEQTSSPNLGSIIEPLENPKKNALTDLEQKYAYTQKQYSDALATHLKRVHSGVKPSQLKTLTALNNQMLDILKQMDNHVRKIMPPSGFPPGGKLKAGRSKVHASGDRLRQHVDSHQASIHGLHQLQGEQQAGRLSANAAYYNYLVWLIVAVTIGAYTLKHISTS